jgi:hypothetical protein
MYLWRVLARPAAGGRAIPADFSFRDGSLHGIQQQLDEELGWREEYRTNGVGLPPGYGDAIG